MHKPSYVVYYIKLALVKQLFPLSSVSPDVDRRRDRREGRNIDVDSCTVPATSVETKPNLCTKQPILNKLVGIIKVPSHSSPQSSTLALTGALK